MPKVLLVEDDPFISEIYEKKLTSSGFEVVLAKTGREALKRATEGGYDIILLDLVIPELTGMEVLYELRGKPEYDKDVVIVVFSNLSSVEEQEAAKKAGANGFISKTAFTPSQVVEEVRRYLGLNEAVAPVSDTPVV